MIVTQEAAGLLVHILAQEEHEAGTVMRLFVQDDELQFGFGTEEEGDFVVEADDTPILAMPQGLADALGQAKIDAEMVDGEPVLTLNQPEPNDNAEEPACGDGCSCCP